MKRFRKLLAAMLALFAIFWCSGAAADQASRISFLQQYRDAQKASNTKYGKYTRGYWDKQLAAKYDGMAVAQNPEGYTRYLSNRGCRLFAYAHAVQLLTGEKASADRQLEILAEFLRADDDPPNAKENYAAYLLQAYGAKHGIEAVNVPQSWSAVQSHFDQGGVILFNSGGHIALAVDYTERVINGRTEQLVLLVDSACEATARRVVSGVCYRGDFTKTYDKSKNVKPAWNEYGRLWIRYSDFEAGTWQACFTSATAKKLASRQVKPLDDRLRIAVVTDPEGCAVLNAPYDAAQVARWADAGEGIPCEAAVADRDGVIWYCTEDGRCLREDAVTVYVYEVLCGVEGCFEIVAVPRIAPGMTAPELPDWQGSKVTTVRFVADGNGDIWAELSGGGFVRFRDMAAQNTEMTFTGLTAGFSLSGVKAPEGDLPKGGKFPLRGVISAAAPILRVEAVVLNRETALPAIPAVAAEPDNLAAGVNINAEVNGVNINSGMTFGVLEKGWYTYVVTVQLGFRYAGQTVLIGEAQVVIESEFTVGGPEGEPALPEQPRLPGDADDDGEVVLADAILILRYGADNTVQLNHANADVNGDGGTDTQDALRLLQYLAGWNVTLL